jgi:hypothetical protein
VTTWVKAVTLATHRLVSRRLPNRHSLRLYQNAFCIIVSPPLQSLPIFVSGRGAHHSVAILSLEHNSGLFVIFARAAKLFKTGCEAVPDIKLSLVATHV